MYEEVGHQLKEQPNWADPVLMMTVKFKNKMLTHNALLFKDVGFPGNFRIVPDLAYEPQRTYGLFIKLLLLSFEFFILT